ncbi:sugar transporter [Trichoderma novae-zelandiae]
MASKKRVYNWYISMVAAMCMVLYGYDASMYNSLQGSDNWLAYFYLDTERDTYMIRFINTTYTISAIIAGFFLGGPFACLAPPSQKARRRRWGMWIGCSITVIATFMQTFAPRHRLGCFIAGRVLVGLAQGIALTSGPVYIGGMAPAQICGLTMAFWQLSYSVGSFIAYWINYACSLHRSWLGEWDWKMMPESPRWHIRRHGNIEAAKAALPKIRDTEHEVDDEILAIREALQYEKEAISKNYTALLKYPSIRKRLYLAFIINVGQQLSLQGTLNTYFTAIYKKVFTLNATWTADRFGRRWLFIIGGIGMGLCMLLVPVIGQTTPDINGTKAEPVGISIVFLLFFTSKIFSMNVCAQAIGMCSQMQNVANTIFQQFSPTFLKNEGLKCLYFFMATNFLLVVFVWFFIPETKRVPLEGIDVLIGGANHVDKGAQILGAPETQGKELDVVQQLEVTKIAAA